MNKIQSIKLTKKDIKQIAESCVKNILKEDFFQNNMNNQYDNDEEEFETDNEPYYDRQQYHNFILKTLENFTNETGDGQVHDCLQSRRRGGPPDGEGVAGGAAQARGGGRARGRVHPAGRARRSSRPRGCIAP